MKYHFFYQIRFLTIICCTFISILSLQSHAAIKAQKSSSTLSHWTPILTWKDAEPFAGKIVALRSNSSYFALDGDFRILDSSYEVRFAHVCSIQQIWGTEWADQVEEGFEINFLVKAGSTPYVRVLSNRHLVSKNTSIRLPTILELREILRIIKTNEGNFEYSLNLERDTQLIEMQLKKFFQ